jgi:proteasome-associated ATPase
MAADEWLDADDFKGVDLDKNPGINPHNNKPEENKLTAIVEKLEAVVTEQQDAINQLVAAPILFAHVISSNHIINPQAFEYGDRVQLIDQEHEAYKEGIKKFPYVHGRIVSQEPVVNQQGEVTVEFPAYIELQNKQFTLSIGINDNKQQVYLLIKNDGTNIVVVKNDGEIQECRNHLRFNPVPGQIAKVNSKTGQVEEITNDILGMEIVKADQILQDGSIEIASQQGSKTIINRTGQEVKPGDRLGVVGGRVALKLLEKKENKFKIKNDLNLSWADVGGQEKAKKELISAIELPARHPEIFKYYQQNPPKGILLYGPPGCGKTLIGKVTACEMAKIYNKQAVDTGFNYVKGPEMLSMWVGNTEQAVRDLFAQGRKHYEEHQYPCITFVDEADAILQERGGSGGVKSERYHDSMVAQWLAEMDGLETANQIVIFATNRPNSLDGALTREGRVDRHIKIRRPDKFCAMEIFRIHLKNVPLHEINLNQLAEMSADLLWEDRPMYLIESDNGSKNIFGLTNCVSGAMIAGIVHEAKDSALHRDLNNGSMIGLTWADMHEAIAQTYIRHRDLNHRFDIADFLEEQGVDEKSVKITKVSMA